MEIINVNGYIIEEKIEIAKKHLLPKQLKEHGLKSKDLQIGKRQLEKIIEGYTRESGVRGLDKTIAKVVRHAASSSLLNSISGARCEGPPMNPRTSFWIPFHTSARIPTVHVIPKATHSIRVSEKGVSREVSGLFPLQAGLRNPLAALRRSENQESMAEEHFERAMRLMSYGQDTSIEQAVRARGWPIGRKRW